MIITVDVLREFVDTNETDWALELRIRALESFICKYTNNDFVSRETGEQEFPPDVQMGAISMLVWQLRNSAQNSGDTTMQPVASETISRHSVTYASDSTESDIDELVGVPRKLSAFLKPYMRARF